MKFFKAVSLSLAFLMITLLTFSSCSVPAPSVTRSVPAVGPEVGVWSAKYHLSDLDAGSLSEEDRLILTMLAGDVLFSVEMEFAENGDFAYRMNTDAIEQALANSVNQIIGWFISFDVSAFTERLLSSALREVMGDYQKTYIGTYTASGTDLQADCSGTPFSFSYHAGTVIQYDEQGGQFLLFSRSE